MHSLRHADTCCRQVVRAAANVRRARRRHEPPPCPCAQSASCALRSARACERQSAAVDAHVRRHSRHGLRQVRAAWAAAGSTRSTSVTSSHADHRKTPPVRRTRRDERSSIARTSPFRRPPDTPAVRGRDRRVLLERRGRITSPPRTAISASRSILQESSVAWSRIWPAIEAAAQVGAPRDLVHGRVALPRERLGRRPRGTAARHTGRVRRQSLPDHWAREQVTLPARCSHHGARRLSRFRRASVLHLIRAQRSTIAACGPS